MRSAAKKVLEDALALPESERAELVDALSESLATGAELSPAWKTEIARRIEAVERGESRLIPGDEAMARLRSAIKPPE